MHAFILTMLLPVFGLTRFLPVLRLALLVNHNIPATPLPPLPRACRVLLLRERTAAARCNACNLLPVMRYRCRWLTGNGGVLPHN